MLEPPRPLHTLGEHSTTEVYLRLSVTQEHVPQNSKVRWRTDFVGMPITQKTQLDDVILRVTETDVHRSLSEQSAKADENAQLVLPKGYLSPQWITAGRLHGTRANNVRDIFQGIFA